MKFIHVSNVNLGASYESDALHQIDRKVEYLSDLKRIVSLAEKESVECLFLTGGVFSMVPDEEALKKVDEILLPLEKTQIFWLFSMADSRECVEKVSDFSFSSKVKVLSGKQIERMYLPSLDAELTALSYDEETWQQIKLSALTSGKKGRMQILLLPSLKDGDNIPAGYDYIGLGGETPYLKIDGKPIYAPGLLEPSGFTDQIKHGFLHGEIKQEEVGTCHTIVRFIPGAYREFLTFKVNATKTVSYEDVKKRIIDSIKKYGENNFYEVILTGEASVSLQTHKGLLMKEIEGVIRVLDHTKATEVEKLPVTSDEAEKIGNLSEFVQSISSKEDSELTKLALKYGVEALLETQEEGE